MTALTLARRPAHHPEARRSTPAEILSSGAVTIVRRRGVVDPGDCLLLIEGARSRVSPSQLEHRNGRGHFNFSTRRSDGCRMTTAYEMRIVATIAERMGLPIEQIDEPHLVRYRAGGFFKPHHDAGARGEIPGASRRVSTCIIALNDDHVGGELVFPHLGARYRGEAGNGILFDNLDADGMLIRESLHAGAPVMAGEKWILVFWSARNLARQAGETPR